MECWGRMEKWFVWVEFGGLRWRCVRWGGMVGLVGRIVRVLVGWSGWVGWGRGAMGVEFGAVGDRSGFGREGWVGVW